MTTDFSCGVNVSRDSVTHSAWSTASEEEAESAAVGYFYATVALLFFIVGLPMNIFVIIVILGRHLCKSVPIILMLNLAISNMATCLLIFPFVIVSGYSENFMFGSSDHIRCRVCSIGIFNVSLPLVSEYTIALMSIERLLYLKLPLKYDSLVTPRRIGVAVLMIWIVCILLSIPPLFGLGEVLFFYKIANCAIVSFIDGSRVANASYGAILAIMGFLGFSVVVVAYLWIICIARSFLFKNTDRYASWGDSQTSAENSEEQKQLNKENRKKQFRMVQLLGLIFGFNAITWLPFTVLALSASIAGPSAVPILFFFFAYNTYLSAVIIYPILQASLTYEIKEAVLVTFKKIFSVCSTKGGT